MKHLFALFLLSMLLFACNGEKKKSVENASPVDHGTIEKTISSLTAKHGSEHQFRIERGVRQAASLWRETDGDTKAFEAFVTENFIADQDELGIVFNRIANSFEFLFGYMDRISVELNRQVQEDRGPVHKIDQMFSSYSPSAHVQEDLFQNKIAFIVALNFPYYTLQEKNDVGKNWDDRQWGYARLGDVFTARIPSHLIQEMSKIASEGDLYISEYNIFAGQLINEKGEKKFPEDMKLLAHWNIRDEIKSNYARTDGLGKQEMLYQVMLRIINQDIPRQVINNPGYQWDPIKNNLYQNGKPVSGEPENTVRYEHLLAHFNGIRKFDPYYPNLDTYIKRTFDSGMEISMEEVEALFKEYASSPLVKDIGRLISKRLGRPLRPFDLWYDGFTTRSSIPEEKLNTITTKLYPNAKVLDMALPQILGKLGFKPETATFLASKIDVDAARGSGHAMPSSMRQMPSHLRTRIGAGGMDYKGYNIAMHELGHNVEQTFSLQMVDNYLMKGVPNNAFTEALAFMFQARDLELLGITNKDRQKAHLDVLDIFWDNYEMMGVSMVDMRVWKWMYDHPDASAVQLKEAVISISKEVWNEYYADVFGKKDTPILSIYSHMIVYPLYLMSYPYGRLIMFQLEGYCSNKNFADETQRIFSIGKRTPQHWMQKAIGQQISNKPIFEAAKKALEELEKK